MKKVYALVTIFLVIILTNGVYAQSQGDINPFFGASYDPNKGIEENRYVEFNYDCTNLLWPVTKKEPKDCTDYTAALLGGSTSIPNCCNDISYLAKTYPGENCGSVPEEQDARWSRGVYDFLDGQCPNESSDIDCVDEECSNRPSNIPCKVSENPNNAISTYRRVEKDSAGNISINTYYVYEGESILDLEMKSRRNTGAENQGKVDSSGDPFYTGIENKRRINKPVLAPNKEEAAKLGLSKELEGYEGRVICGTIPVLNGSYLVAYADPVDANFVPPALQQLENYALDIIYGALSLAGLYFTGQLLIIGYKKMTEGFSPEQKGEVMKKLATWVVGLIGLFLAIPALRYVYGLLDLQHTKCFYQTEEVTNGAIDEKKLVYDLTLPGFTFFFKDVCTGEYSE